MRQKLKILFYTHALTGGGAERVWALLASGFAARGHDVTFAVDFESDENADYLDSSVRLVVLGGNHLQSALRLTRLIRAQKPDFTLSAIGVSNIKHAVASLLCGTRKRAIQSYHGYYESEPQLLSRLGYLLTPLLTRFFARSIAVSEGLHDYLLTRWRASARRTLRIYNPVRAGKPGLAPTAAELAARAPLVLAVGRLVAYKNFLGLVRAFAQVARPDARLLILGEGPEHAAIDAEIARLGLGARVRLGGYLSQPWPHYAKARCLALSSDSESFGLVIVEALAHGLPVVSTDSHGPREILDNGRHGALVAHRDEAALARALEAALDHPGDPEPRIARADVFSVDVGLDAYQVVFDALLAPGKSGALARGEAAASRQA